MDLNKAIDASIDAVLLLHGAGLSERRSIAISTQELGVQRITQQLHARVIKAAESRKVRAHVHTLDGRIVFDVDLNTVVMDVTQAARYAEQLKTR